MKAFAFGAGVGAIVCLAVIRVTDSLVAPTDVAERPPDESIEAAYARDAEPTNTVGNPVPAKRTDPQSPPSGPSLANKQCISLETLSEEDARAILERTFQLQRQR